MNKAMQTAGSAAATKQKSRKTDGTHFFTTSQTAARWSFHPESVRRLLRRGQIESVVIGRRRLVPVEEIERVENEGRIARVV